MAMLFCIRTSFKPSRLYSGILGIDMQLLDLNSFDCKLLHYVLKCVLREIRAVVLSEDKAQDKGKRIIVIIIILFLLSFYHIQYVSINIFWLSGVCA